MPFMLDDDYELVRELCLANSLTLGVSASEIHEMMPPVPDDPDERIAEYIAANWGANPTAMTVRRIGKALGLKKSTVARSPYWKAFIAEHKGERARGGRIQQLTRGMLAVIAAPVSRETELARLKATQEAEDENPNPCG